MNIQLYKVIQVKEKGIRYELQDRKIRRPEDAYELLKHCFSLHQSAEENFGIICLNTKNIVIGIHLISKGTLNETLAHPREVFKSAILNNADNIILFHNHPSNDPTPSHEDILLTRRMHQSAQIIGIPITDHIIITLSSFASLKQLSLIPD